MITSWRLRRVEIYMCHVHIKGSTIIGVWDHLSLFFIFFQIRFHPHDFSGYRHSHQLKENECVSTIPVRKSPVPLF